MSDAMNDMINEQIAQEFTTMIEKCLLYKKYDTALDLLDIMEKEVASKQRIHIPDFRKQIAGLRLKQLPVLPEQPDVDEVVQELESFRIHLPLHTRDESMPVCNLVIGKLWAMDADIDKYKTALENIFREAQLPGYSPLVIANYAGYSLYGDGVQDKVVVPVEVERACDSCLHGTRSRSCRPCIDCLRPRSSWKPRGEAPVPVERNCGTCFHFKENVDSRPCSNCVRMRNHPNWIPKAVEVPVEKECSSCLHEDKSSMTEPCYSCDGRNNWQPKKVVVPVAEECDTCLHENDYWKVAPCSTCSKDGNWQPKKERLTP